MGSHRQVSYSYPGTAGPNTGDSAPKIEGLHQSVVLLEMNAKTLMLTLQDLCPRWFAGMCVGVKVKVQDLLQGKAVGVKDKRNED